MQIPSTCPQAEVSGAAIMDHGKQEALRHRWIESEKAGRDLGNEAERSWIRDHWNGYLRSRWLEHLHGQRFWRGLKQDDFGLLRDAFQDKALLLDRILDRFKCGQENLDIINWAHTFGIPFQPLFEILVALDINGRRLVCQFDS